MAPTHIFFQDNKNILIINLPTWTNKANSFNFIDDLSVMFCFTFDFFTFQKSLSISTSTLECKRQTEEIETFANPS